MLTRSIVPKMAGNAGSAQDTAVSLVHRGTRVVHSSTGKKKRKKKGEGQLCYTLKLQELYLTFFKGPLILVPDLRIILFVLK